MSKHKRITHEERAKRRELIREEGLKLKGQLDKTELLCYLCNKYDVGHGTVIKIIDYTMTGEERAARRFEIAQEASALSGTMPKSDVIQQLTSKFGVSVGTVQKSLKEHSVSILYMPKPKVPRAAYNKSVLMENAVFEGIKSGYTVNELSKKLDCTRENVYRYYRRLIKEGKLEVVADTAIRRKKAEMREKCASNIERILELHNKRFNIPAIARELQLPSHMVSSVIRDNSPLTTKSSFRHLKYKWLSVIADLFNAELTVGDIAAKHNKHSSCISQLIIDCKSIGIPLPEQRRDGRSVKS